MPNWKKIVTSGSDAALNSLNVTSGVTGSLLGTASFATTASYVLNAVSSSFATSASFASTSSFVNRLNQNLTLVGNQTITGSLTVTNDLIVLGSASIQFISQSTLNIGTNLITVNTFSPSARFGGLAVIDSGSSPLISASFLYDSVHDEFIFVHKGDGTNITSSHFLVGPQTYNDIGNEIYIPNNTILKSQGNEHVTSSNITDTGTLVGINSNTTITGSFTVTTGSNVELQVLNTGVRLGNIVTDTHTITGSLGVSGSSIFNGNTTVTGSLNITSGVTGSLLGTASFALTASNTVTAQTASFLTIGNDYQVNSIGVGTSPSSPFKINSYGQIIIQNGINNAIGQQSLIFAYPGITNSLTHSIYSGHDASVANFNKLDFYISKTSGQVNVLSLRSAQPVLIGSGTGLGLDVSGSTTITGSFTVTTGSNVELQVLDTGVRIGNVLTDAHTVTGSLGVSGSLIITGSGANTLQVIGSGSGIASNTIQARNGAGTASFTVRNDGKTVVGSNSGSTASGVLTIFQGGSSFGNGINFQTTANDANQFGIGASSTSIIQMGFNAGFWNVVGNRLGSSLVSLDTNGYGTLGTGLYGSGIDIQGTYTNPGGAGFGNGGGRGGNSFVDSVIVTVNASSTNTLAQYATLFANRTVTITGSQLPISSIVLNNTYNQTQTLSSGSIIGINHMPVLTSAYNYRAFDFGNTTVYTPNAAVTDYIWSRISSNISASVNNQFIVGLDIILSGSNSSFTGVRRSALRLTTQNSSDAALTAVGTVIITGSLIVTGGITGSLSGSSGGGTAFPFTGSAGISGSLSVNGPISGSYVRLSGSFNTAASGSILTVIGSGSAQPIFTVQGSQGELFSVTDSLTGSLFSVNDISGLPILEVFSDNTIVMGDYQDPMLLTTKKVIQTNSGSFIIYSIPTSSYDGVFIDYTIKSGSNARAGTIMSTWAGSSIQFSEVDTMDIGDTAVVGLTMILSGSNAVMTGSSSTGSWTIRTIIRAV
jgi:hypothetical protein